MSSTLRKLKSEKRVHSYDAVFMEWLQEEIVNESCQPKDHYLPHPSAFKENSATKVRPVFDASARENDNPSLNMCLEKGHNLIELIPSMLIRFREIYMGVVSDIRKAFLQSIRDNDRDFLKFL